MGVMVVVLGVVVVLGEDVETGVDEGVDEVVVKSCAGMLITTWAYETTPLSPSVAVTDNVTMAGVESQYQA